MFTKIKIMGIVLYLICSNVILAQESQYFKITKDGLYSLKEKKVINSAVRSQSSSTYVYSIESINGSGESLTFEAFNQSKKQCYAPIYHSDSDSFIKNIICFEIVNDFRNTPPVSWIGELKTIKQISLSKINVDYLFHQQQYDYKVFGKQKNNLLIFNKLPILNESNKYLYENHEFIITTANEGFPFISLSNIKIPTNKKEKLLTLSLKSPLYKEPSESSQSKMYLITGDKVKLLDTQTDESGQEWYYISYQGKKEIKAWIKAEVLK